MPDIERENGSAVAPASEQETITMYGPVDEMSIIDGMNTDAAPAAQRQRNPLVQSILQLALTLCAITFVTAVLLGAVNAVTAPKIAERNAAAKAAAMEQVLPGADRFEPVDITPTKLVSAVSAGQADGRTLGYAVTTTPTGFGGAMEVMVGVSAEGKVTGVSIVTSSETAGLGSKASDESFRSQFTGKAGGIEVVKSGADDTQINAISGATITSKAVTEGVNAAVETALALSGEGDMQ